MPAPKTDPLGYTPIEQKLDLNQRPSGLLLLFTTLSLNEKGDKRTSKYQRQDENKKKDFS